MHHLAIGAKGKHVLLQFLLEAMALSIVGGAIGVALGLVIPNLDIGLPADALG